MFKKIDSKDKTKSDAFYSSSKSEMIINKSDIDYVFQSIYTTIILNIQKSLGKGSNWIIDSVIDHTVSISKYNRLAGSSYIKLPKELDHPRNDLINVQNTDDHECFKWCLVRYLNLANHHPRRNTKADKEFGKRLDFKDMKFPLKTRDIHKIEKKNPSALALLVMKTRKNMQFIYQNNVVKRLIIGRRRRKNIMFLSNVSIHSCKIIHYIVEENIFIVLVYMLSKSNFKASC